MSNLTAASMARRHARRDACRDTYMKTNGYRVLRFWNNDVMQNVDGVLQVIAEALSRRCPPPRPLPPLAGGTARQR